MLIMSQLGAYLETPAEPWQSLFEVVFSTTMNFSSSTSVQKYNGVLASKNQYRITLNSSTDAGTISSIYFGEAATTGDAFDFKSSPAPVAVTFGASSSLAMTANQSYTSDPISFAGTGGIIMISWVTGSDLVLTPRINMTGPALYYKNSVSEASTVNKSGYTSYAQQGAMLVSKIEGRNV